MVDDGGADGKRWQRLHAPIRPATLRKSRHLNPRTHLHQSRDVDRGRQGVGCASSCPLKVSSICPARDTRLMCVQPLGWHESLAARLYGSRIREAGASCKPGHRSDSQDLRLGLTHGLVVSVKLCLVVDAEATCRSCAEVEFVRVRESLSMAACMCASFAAR